jgi:lysine-N-methylase
LQGTTRIRARYAESFRCIGSACEDTCCQGWGVPIDQATFEKYQSLPASPLREEIEACVVRSGDGGADQAAINPKVFAKIQMDASNRCPLLSREGLCRVQAELGEALLSHTCATYPRIEHSAGGLKETALTLSCPEAARLVLLTPDLPGMGLPGDWQQGEEQMAGAAQDEESRDSLPPNFWEIRESVFWLVRYRAYPLWQRMFLLGVFCQRLDSIARGELRRSVPEFLQNFKVTVGTNALRMAMEMVPFDRAAQLDVVLRLAGLMLHRSNVRPRFVECIAAFREGIGNGPGATLDSLAAGYSLAYDKYYEPFFRRHPHILENYLINTIARCQFPFGREGMLAGEQAQTSQELHGREFASLTVQFALMKGLLIGVAGFHREAFSAAHVVHTVQSASKHFEHHPEFLKLAHELLVESQMDGARGLGILLRNARPKPASEGNYPASPEIQGLEWQRQLPTA